jgi:hypothetical protein
MNASTYIGIGIDKRRQNMYNVHEAKTFASVVIARITYYML